MSGQSIVDRLNAAKHTVAGSALGRAVVKATTEEIMAPKRKHLDYLLQCTSEINVSIPQMADLLIERTQNTSWVVTFKALITIHHLMCYGNERFSQYMASHNSKFHLNNFVDKTSSQGIDMTSYIRKYAAYLNEKRETYKLMGYDFCKVKRGKEDGMLRTMNTEKLLKTLPILQKQLDALVGFDVQPNELTNGVINGCFVLLSKDLIRLFACYNDGVINLLEKFFDMNKKNAKEALEIYKKFLERTDNVSAFLKVAESSGMDKSDIPDLTKAPSSLLDALESHVNSMENKSGGGQKTTGASGQASNGTTGKPPSSYASAIDSLQGNSSLSPEEAKKFVEEEAKTLEQYKTSNNPRASIENNHLKKQASLSSPTSNTPFGNGSNGHQKSNQDDLFGLDLTGATTNGASSGTNGGGSASDDLLMLSGPNPFIQNIVNQSYATPVNPMMGGGVPMVNPMINPFQTAAMPGFGGAMYGGMPAMNQFQPMQANPAAMGNSKPDDLFSGLSFSTSATTPTNAGSATEFDAFGDILQPTSASGAILNPTSNKPNNNSDKTPTDSKIISKDLDSSLASLADNLDIKGRGFNSQQNQAKTGGQAWKPGAPTQAAPMAAAWNPALTSNPMGAPSMGQWPGGFQAPVNPQAAAMPQMQQKPVSSTNPFDLF